MVYLTLKEASKATGLNEATIRRLCKKPDSKSFIRMKDGKKGPQYTIQSNYLFSIYEPKEQDYTRIDKGVDRIDNKPIQEYTMVLAAKDELIQSLKSENSYLRDENRNLREENRDLKLLPPAPVQVTAPASNNRVSNLLYMLAGIIMLLGIAVMFVYILVRHERTVTF